MAKSIKQIQKDLDALKVIVGEAGQELQDLYISYLNLLGQSVKQQLISAIYHICTQIYPESFLKLSLNSKQKIQQKSRELGNTVQPNLLDIVDNKEISLAPQELSIVAEMLKNLSLSPKDDNIKEEQKDLDSLKLETKESEAIETEIEENLDDDSNSEEINKKQEVDFNNPEHLVFWHKQNEREIRKILDKISKQANKYLQKSGVIPNRLPAKVMEVAMQAEESTSRGNGNKVQNIPNILNLVIETDQEKKVLSSNIIQISLLRLRLSELEFIDPLLNAKRTQIRTLISKINQLKRQYRDKKREYAQAEAEAAWRSSWYEE